MKLFSTLTAVALSAAAASAAPMSIHQMQGLWKNLPANHERVALKSVPRWTAPITRSAENPTTNFTAEYAEFYYMGDVLGNGTGVYSLYLSNQPMDKGMPTETCQMARLEIIGTPTDESNPELCTGTFTVVTELTFETAVEGTLVAEDSDVLDVFPYPGDPSQGLVAYPFSPTEGTLTIEKEGDDYSISFNMEVALYGDDDEVLFSDSSACTYQGPCTYVDIYAYTPFDTDVTLPELRASGRYTDGGDYSISFYTDGLLDDEGWIVGAGYLLNAELFVEDVSPMDVNNLVGTFTPWDVMQDGPKPGTFGEGVWYPIFGSWYVAIMTSLTEYDQYGQSGKVALAIDGTIIGTKLDETTYRLEFDLTSAEGYKVTGTYEGDLAADITDFSTNVGVKDVAIEAGNVFGSNGCIIAPEGAKVYNLNGIETGANNLMPGIYMVRVNDKTYKVTVR